MNFKNIYNETKDNVESSMLSLWAPGRHRMRAALKDLFEREPLLAKPIFQSMFPWENTEDANWKNYLNKDVIKRLKIGKDAGGEHNPYQHQTDSWKELHEGNSIVVTSGTGSGKTECFMYPVISDLYEQRLQGEDSAVEALFLYPLNALMQDQKDRLGGFCQTMGLRFAVYNSSLKGVGPEVESYSDAEVRSRADVRQPSGSNDRPSLPHILLTNPSMLEYMMVRMADQPIFARSQRKLRWIVIDEAHTYTGSAAIEMAYLLKRVLNAFGVNREDVRIVCTSATIGDPAQPQQLIDFIETIIGQYPAGSQKKLVHIDGDRTIPAVTNDEIQQELNSRGITCTTAQSVSLLRNEVNRKAMRVDEIWQLLTATPMNDINAALELVDQLCDIQIHGNYVLMLRGHFFMRSIGGLYACVNQHCNNNTEFRKLGFEFLTTKIGDGYCPHCGAPLLEVVQCDGCKEFLLMCEENNTKVVRNCGDTNSGGQAYELEDGEDDNDDDITDGGLQTDDGWEKKYFAFYGNGRQYAKPHPDYFESNLAFEWNGNVLKTTNRSEVKPWYELANGHNLYCPTCAKGSGADGKKFKAFRLTSNWMNNTIAPALLLEGADRYNSWGKYIAFTDSRQGTAINAKKFNVDSERAYARSHIVENLMLGQLYDVGQIADFIFNQQLFDHIHYDVNQRNKKGNKDIARDVDAYKTALVRSIIGRLPVKTRSVENLGLITITYPQVDNSTAPNSWIRANFSDEEWRSFVKISIDYLIRQGNHLQRPTNNEYAYIRDTDNSTPFDLNQWPQVSTNNNGVRTKQSRLVLLLCAALNIDSPSSLNNNVNKINTLLNDVRNFLEQNILTKVDVRDNYCEKNQDYLGYYYLDLSLNSNKCKVKLNTASWICPVSNYLLDTIFRGYSPHITGCLSRNNIDRYKCSTSQDITMPIYNAQIPYGQWVADSAEVANMMNLGVWNDLHKYAYQPKNVAYLTAEHSGQQDRDLLSYYTAEFKATPHRLNLLQCSTTMEMGVDIGDIELVLMTTIPPSSANYLQRAGRAGRNGQSRSVAYSICPNTSLGVQAFYNPMSCISSHNNVVLPKPSVIIIQRHINSFFLREYIVTNNIIANKVGEWMQNQGHIDNFNNFLAQIVNDTNLRQKYETIFANNVSYQIGISTTSQRITSICQEYRKDWNALEAEWQNAYNANDNSKMIAIDIQLDALADQDLKGYLSEKQFLPNANMPTGVVEFNFIKGHQYDEIVRLKNEIDDLDKRISNTQDERQRWKLEGKKQDKRDEIEKIREKTVSSREIKIALSEYAPDQSVVINEQNLKSEGVEWKNSFYQGNPLKYLYYCQTCKKYVYSNNGNLTHCDCGTGFVSVINPRRDVRTIAIEPVRFRTDINRGNNIRENAVKRYYQIETILTNVDWTNPQRGPMCELVGNGNGQGEIVFYNKGCGTGFKLCLNCGRMILQDNNRGSWPHKPLLERNAINNCVVSSKVKTNVVLSGTFPTTYVSIRFFKDSSLNVNGYVDDVDLLYSLGVVLTKALSNVIGVDSGDIDFDIREERDGRDYKSLFIYDTMKGGCGYSTEMLDPQVCNAVFNEAKRLIASYQCHCETNSSGACVHCLVNRNSQRYEKHLSKYKLATWFAGQTMSLASSTITGAPAIPMTLKHLVTEKICSANVTGLTFCVDASEMNIDDWVSRDGEMGSLLRECDKHGKSVTILVSNVPSVAKGNTLSEIIPFADLPSKLPDYTVEAIDSLERTPGVYSALIVDGAIRSHYFVEQQGVLPFTEKWGDNCNALYGDQNVPTFKQESFPTITQILALNRPTNYIRSGSIRNMNTTIGRFYADVIQANVLQPNDVADITEILSGKRVNITFSDSYVNSALASLMLTYLIKSIRDLCDFEIGRVDLQFQAPNRNCNNPRWNDYTYINLSFPDAEMADDYTKEQFEGILEVTPNFLGGIPDHCRWLCFQPEGEDCNVEIRPDYSIAGGWQSPHKYMDADRLDGNTVIKTKSDTVVVYYVFINKEENERE